MPLLDRIIIAASLLLVGGICGVLVYNYLERAGVLP